MVNRVTLIGRLGQDPEVRRLENGATVAKFSVATNENYRDKSGEWQSLTEWHDVVVWRTLAERAESQLAKGALVYLDGKLTHRTWQDKDGNNRKTTEVVGSYFRRLDKREEGPGGGGGGHFPAANDEMPNSDNFGDDNTAAPVGNDAPTNTDTGQDDDLPF